VSIPILPRTAAAATVGATLVAVVIPAGSIASAFAFSLTILLLAAQSNPLRAGKRLVGWTIPFVVPLVILHSVLNGQFPVAFQLWGIVPIRPEGFEFGLAMALQFMLLAVAAAYWLAVDRDEIVESLVRLHLPSWLLLFLMQSTAMAVMIKRRIDNVFLAQRARGVPVGAGTWDRLRALPAVLVPVVVSTLVEADARVPALVARGFGSINPRPLPRHPIVTGAGLLFVIPLLLAVLAIFADLAS
jgi:energy-coupling factor transport system permease protein